MLCFELLELIDGGHCYYLKFLWSKPQVSVYHKFLWYTGKAKSLYLFNFMRWHVCCNTDINGGLKDTNPGLDMFVLSFINEF